MLYLIIHWPKEGTSKGLEPIDTFRSDENIKGRGSFRQLPKRAGYMFMYPSPEDAMTSYWATIEDRDGVSYLQGYHQCIS